MPKLKTHTGAKKRFRITKSGKAIHSKAGKSHMLTSKEKDRKRNLRKRDVLSKSEITKIRAMLPY